MSKPDQTKLPGAASPRSSSNGRAGGCLPCVGVPEVKKSDGGLKAFLPLARRRAFRDLPNDVWGITVLTIVRDYSSIVASKGAYRHTLRLLFTLGCLVLTVFTQVILLHWIGHYVVDPSIRNIQANYHSYRKAVFNDGHGGGTFSDDSWQHYDGARVLCGYALTDRYFLSAVLFIWLARMLYKVKDTCHLAYHIQRLPTVAGSVSEDDMVDVKQMTEGEEVQLIKGISNGVRHFIHIFTTLPKLAVSVFITYMGLNWFTAAESFQSLLFTFVAMEFIVNLDELVFKCFFPDTTVEYVANTRLAIQDSAKSEEDELSTLHHDYHISYIILILVVVLAVSYAHYLQQVIPGYAGDVSPQTCARFYSPDGICKPFQWGCFPYGHQEGGVASESPSGGQFPAVGGLPGASHHNLPSAASSSSAASPRSGPTNSQSAAMDAMNQLGQPSS